MRSWISRFEYLLWPVILIGLFYFVVSQENLSGSHTVQAPELVRAVEQQLVESLQVDGLQLKAFLTLRGRKEFQTSTLTLDGPLPYDSYETLLQKKLTSTQFLGPVAGINEPDYVERWRKNLVIKSSGTPYFKQRLEVSAMGLTAGALTWQFENVEHKVDGPLLKISLSAMTDSQFRNIYQVHDVAEIFVRLKDGVPLLEHISFTESDQCGESWVFQSAKELKVERRIYSRRNGRQFSTLTYPLESAVHLLGSALYAVTHSSVGSRSLRIFDLNEFHDLQLITTSTEPPRLTLKENDQTLPIEIVLKSQSHEIDRVRVRTVLGWVEAEAVSL